MNHRKYASDAYRSHSGKKNDNTGGAPAGDTFEPLSEWLKRRKAEGKDSDASPESSQNKTARKKPSPGSEGAGGTKKNAEGQGPSGGTKQEGAGQSPFSGFLKTGSGARKAAKLLLLLGKERASEVLRHLSQEEIEAVTKEIAKIKRIEKEEAEKLLQEFGNVTQNTSDLRGGYNVARNILKESFGEEKAEGILKKVRPTGEEKPFAFLADLDYQQIMMLLRKESPHVVTLVLSYLPPGKSSEVLESFPPDFQLQVVKRMAKLERVSPEALTTVEEKLKERLRTQGKVVTEEVDGQKVLAEILKHLSPSDGNRILDSLTERYGEVAEQVRERLYSIEIVHDIPDKELEEVLRKWDERELAVILKGVSKDVEERILAHLSARKREFISYEREELGVMRRSEVDKPIKEFIDYLRGLIESGEIVLQTDEWV
ncbi:MAG: flagellar motor switch protein FliG [Spirochaetia bacterium]